MKSSNILFLGILLAGLFTFSSCGDNIDCTEMATLQAKTNSLLQAFQDTGDAYVANPDDSDACKDFRKAGENLLDFWRDIEECAPADESDVFRENLISLEDSIDLIEC